MDGALCDDGTPTGSMPPKNFVVVPPRVGKAEQRKLTDLTITEGVG